MPELPEVETIVRGLQPLLTGRRLTDVRILNPASAACGEATLRERVTGRTVKSVRRRAKLILCGLGGASDPEYLVFHLKMTGRLLVAEREEEIAPHTRLVFGLDNGANLLFSDQRKFGYGAVFTPDELAAWPFYASLGPEPLEIAPPEFLRIFNGRKGRIKALLLNQHILAGIGNIYADESLFQAGIHPAAAASSLDEPALVRLHGAIQAVLHKALALGGSSFRDYVNALGKRGAFQEEFCVYGKRNGVCPVCAAVLRQTIVAGRTSTFCPACQPL